MTHDASPWRVALTGMVAMAVAMGIGRFAFTPLLPMMLHDGAVDLLGASWLASANYLGYLVGAMLCTFQPWVWRRLGWHGAVDGPAMVRLGLLVTAMVTAGMALHWPWGWPLLRFIAGVASAVVFVYVSGWCVGRLAHMQVPEMGALIFIGPGAGIVISGVFASAFVALGISAAISWLVFGVLAAVLSALIWQVLRSGSPTARAAVPQGAAGTAQAPTRSGNGEIALLAVSYGLAGLGYIISATFLPVIARQAIPQSIWLDLFWPLFGLGIMVGALIASRIRSASDLRWRLAACYLLQASGVVVGLVWPSSTGFAIGSFLLGLPMTAITFFALQEVRRVAPQQSVALMGLITAVYGLGQVAGPPLTAAFLERSASVDAGFDQALLVAAGALVLGALLYAAMVRMYPVRRV